MRFYDYTIVQGRIDSQRVHESTQLVRAAVAVFQRLLNQGPHGTSLIPGWDDYRLVWTCERSNAIATFRYREIPMTTNLLLSGRDRDAERSAINALAGMEATLAATMEAALPGASAGSGLGFDLARIRARPALCTLILPSSLAVGADLPHALGLIADMETCLAAAFFEAVVPLG
jgi:hypothetical protein